MKEIYFFRNVKNYNELIYKDKIKRRSSNNSQNYKIIDSIILDKNKYLEFLECFNKNWEFIYKYIDQMKIINDVWYCILISSKGYEGVLIMSDGYQYPRFIAIFFNENNFDSKKGVYD